MLPFRNRVSRWLQLKERGNVAVLFAFMMIPLLLLMGGAVDFARYARHKAVLANAVDAAALALAKEHDNFTAAQATTFVTDYVNAFNVADSAFTVSSVNVTKITNGFHVTAIGNMKTIFLGFGKLITGGSGIGTLTADIVAEVVNASKRVELALVLDNTGSMNCGTVVSSSCTGNWSSPNSSSRIAGLKTAATTLINILMTGTSPDPDLVKIAVVPFEGTVNTGYSSNNVPSWIDWNDTGKADWTGVNLDMRDTSTGASCTTGWNCKYIGHKWLFDKLHARNSNVKWEGCVEMRASPYDILDTTPTSATPDTLYVPFFWPDEPDSNNDGGYGFQNNYLNDKGTFTTGGGGWGGWGGWGAQQDPVGAQKSFTKYYPSNNTNNIQFQSGAPDTSFPFENGPNYGCPRPIVPLTNSKTAVQTAITNLIAYPAMGTYIPSGLVWGWHVLSPTEPFTEGVGPSSSYYNRTLKALVLLTDGENSVTGVSNPNNSIFSAYNYVNTTDASGNHHLGSNDANTAESNLNAKTAALCANVKTNGTSTKEDDIRVYTITFGNIPSSAKTLMQNCASVVDGVTLYYHAPDNTELQNIFAKIGRDLADIHLSM